MVGHGSLGFNGFSRGRWSIILVMCTKKNVIVAVDECVDKLDALTTRAIFCCSELNSTNKIKVEHQLEELKKHITYDGKFHMSSIKDHSTQEKIAEFVCTLPFIATLLVFYSSYLDSRQVKIKALRTIIKEENRLALASNKIIDYHIEYSNEYEEIIAKNNLKSSTDDILTFLSDVVCYAYRLALNNSGKHTMYSHYVRDKIRLEIRATDTPTNIYMTRLHRQNKL